MQVDVSNILRQGEGAREDFTISEESPDLDGIKLTGHLNGIVQIIGTNTGVLVDATLEAAVALECGRCLKLYEQVVKFPVQAEFEDHPSEDQFPITKFGKIDLSEPVRQELEVHLPLKALCQEDCTGIPYKANEG